MRRLALGALYATALLAGTALMRAVRWAPMTWRNPFARYDELRGYGKPAAEDELHRH